MGTRLSYINTQNEEVFFSLQGFIVVHTSLYMYMQPAGTIDSVLIKEAYSFIPVKSSSSLGWVAGRVNAGATGDGNVGRVLLLEDWWIQEHPRVEREVGRRGELVKLRNTYVLQ